MYANLTPHNLLLFVDFYMYIYTYKKLMYIYIYKTSIGKPAKSNPPP